MLATLGGFTFRVNPKDINWNFTIKTAVRNTLGGRVVQVLGANISDLTVVGDFGQEHGSSAGESWRLAEAFIKAMREIMLQQTADAQRNGQLMQPPINFTVPDYGWSYPVYVKQISDGRTQDAVSHAPDHFSYSYAITLFPVVTGDLNDPFSRNHVADQKRKAIEGAVARISAGIGWRKSQYSDPALVEDEATGTTTYKTEATLDTEAVP